MGLVSAIAFLPFPDLSFHWEMLEPLLKVNVERSAASSHSARPGMTCGENDDAYFELRKTLL
jgi:hypothetical protein